MTSKHKDFDAVSSVVEQMLMELHPPYSQTAGDFKKRLLARIEAQWSKEIAEALVVRQVEDDPNRIEVVIPRDLLPWNPAVDPLVTGP